MRPLSLSTRRLALALLLAGTAAGAVSGGPALAAPARNEARCELRVERAGGGVALTALAHADAPVSGRYALRVSGAGTDIRQGGSFSAAPGRPATLGTVSLGSRQLAARAALDLTVDGRTLTCRSGAAGGL